MLVAPISSKIPALLILLALTQIPLSGQMIIDGYDPLTNDRFANDPSFIAAGYDLSGLGRRPSNPSSNTWGTLISQNVFLSSYHWHPTAGQTLTFFESNDPLGPSITRTIIGGQQVGATDLWIGILGQSLPAQYTPFPFLDEPITNESEYNSSSFADSEVFMVGRAPALSSGIPATNVAFGRNRLEGWRQNITVFFSNGNNSSTGSALEAIQHLPGDIDFLSNESFLIIYDSSAPLLQEIGGTLTIIGLNWFTSNPNKPETQIDINPNWWETDLRDYSGFAYVGNYAADLQAVIDAFQVDATAGYLTWAQSAFGGTTDIAQTGPSLDWDGDGLINFLEYVFALDPLSAASLVPGTVQSVDDGGSSFVEVTFSAREDPDLQYAVRLGNDLASLIPVALNFSGSSWTSADPLKVDIASESDLGGGVWQLVVRVTDPLVPGAPQLVSLSAEIAP